MSADLEQLIKQTGLRLYQLIADESPSVFNKQYWMGKVLEWCMQNEDFKVELFRFVDVFPCLTSSESIIRHLMEYFCRPGQNFPAAMQWGIESLSPDSIAAKMVAKTIARNISTMAEQFIAGPTPEDALQKLTALRAEGMAFTADLLGEAVLSEQEAEVFVNRYLGLLDTLGSAQKKWEPLGNGSHGLDWGYAPQINISVKPSSLYSQMNPRDFARSVAMAKERLRPIFRTAVRSGAFVLLDMEHTQLKSITHVLFQNLMEEKEFRGYPHAGIVIQAYLKESEQDLRDLIQWCKRIGQQVTVRLVKGAYWDSEVIRAQQNTWTIPVFTNKYATDANFEKLARILLENHQYLRCACASHNIRSIAFVMETAQELQVPDERVEYQVLYGMAEPIRAALLKAGLHLRLYAPIGAMIPGMAYLVRRLLENTSNESFLRKSFAKMVPQEELLQNPEELLQKNSLSSKMAGESSATEARDRFRNEPLLNWAISESREQLAASLEKIGAEFPYEIPLYCGGKTVLTSNRIISVDPNNPERLVGIVASAGIAEVQAAIAAARSALPAWRDAAPELRASYLFKAAAVTRQQRYELAALEVYEAGKNWSEADADVCEAIDYLEYYGREMMRLGQPKRMGDVPGEVSLHLYEPRGIGAVIAPWNFPLAISMGMASAAIVTGNTIVYKPSSLSPVIGSMVYKIFAEAGLPTGVVNYMPGAGSEIGDYLVSHPDIALIAFTGSRDVGLHIIELARKTPPGAASVKTIIAEMGGKNAVIVDADADLDEVVVHILQSAFSYQGQKCSACSRVIVLKDTYEKLVARLKAAAESIQLSPAEDPGSFMGAVIDAVAQEKIEQYAEIGKKEGTLLLERAVPGAPGFFVPLRIFTDIRPEHRLAQEEIFGPILSIIQVEDFDEALAVANSTEYALTGALFSRSPMRIGRAHREFRVGNLYINRSCTGAIVGRHPFGGFKMSGIGSKAGGPDYLLQFMLPRTVTENTMRRGFAPSAEKLW